MATKRTSELRDRYFNALAECIEAVNAAFEKTVGCEFKAHLTAMEEADTVIAVYDPDDPLCEREVAAAAVAEVLDSSGIYTEFKGVMTENYVLGELVKHVDATPYYWVSGNSAEIDFIVQCGARIVPIEVKAESNVKARSLAEYRKKYAPPVSDKTSMLDDVGGSEVRLIPLYLIGSMGAMIQPESKTPGGNND